MKHILSLTLMLSILVCNAQNSKLEEIVSELGDRFEEYIPQKNIEKVMELYAEDGKYLPENEGIFIGKEQIRAHWEKTFTFDIVGFKMTPKTVDGDSKLIYETGIGESIIRMNDKEVPFRFKYVNVWRKAKNGKYELVIDTYNRAPDDGA